MCKKQRYFIKTKTRWLLLFFSLFILLLIPYGTSAQISNVLDGIEDQLNKAVIERDFDTLWTLRNHSDGAISYRASMALIHSEPVHNDWLFQQVIESKSVRDWMVLSHANLEAHHLNELQRLTSEQVISQEYACEVFYRQGDVKSLQLLLNGDENISTGERCAMAIGGLLSRFEITDTEIHKVLDIYERSSDLEVRRNLLYGFYRSDLNRPAKGTDIHKRMAALFLDHASTSPVSLIDQYFVRALGSEGVQISIEERSDEELTEHIQFAVELAGEAARAVDLQSLTMFTEKLIQHPNKHVRVQLLESLKDAEYVSSELLPILENHLNLEAENPEILLSYLDLLAHLGQDISSYVQSLDKISIQNPYLINRVYVLMEGILDRSEFTEMLLDDLCDEGIRSYRAAEALGALLDYDLLDEERKISIRKILIGRIMNKNRSVLDSSALVLSKTGINDEDILALAELYKKENENSETGFSAELYELISEVAPEIQNDLSEPVLKPFREPDMNQIAELGNSPAWILETNKGEIRIRLYPQEAPFTVSSIENLTTSGFYDDVPFHRVVRMHVIQGGDFDRRDGFGGPPYRIPTEPSVETFSRGKVGIASSGPDTEGSQFFITHTWRPHLDGLYTIFGEVTEGMDVVDRIQIGDIVISARIE